MENYSYSSYPDSRDSSPRSREIDSENPSWDELNNNSATNYKVKFMCSYGGKIQPRPHDNQLAYIGGDTKILAVDRNIKFSALVAKLSSLCDADVFFKYQLPGEDLDALISVTNDEDLEHMMVEYDRLYRASAKPARLRLFLFPLAPSAPASFGSSELKSERQWFVDALNSVQIQQVDGSSPPAPVSATNPDFLFGLDKAYPGVPATKLPDSVPVPTAPDAGVKDLSAGSECVSEDRHAVGEPLLSPAEIQRQIQDLQRLHIVNNDQLLQRKSDEGNGRVYTVDYFPQKNPEKVAPPPAPLHAHTGPVPVPVSASAAFLPERHMTSAAYPLGVSATGTDQQQPVYLIPTPAAMYHATTLRPVTGPVGQPYYGGVPRMVPAEMYNAAPPSSLSHTQPKVGAYNDTSGIVQQPKVGVSEPGYAQVAYDNAGRQVYYAAAASAPPSGGVVPPYQVATAGIDGRQQGGGALNQEAIKPTKAGI
ncbi:uncharacterized protein LOC129294124 isoform X2 [Prosopis cineraria]|uniref:uncharacterized protein LOC129294124 isoform X2 n=1 Tax=Prosopis cineraria TaxID=364024 RepID=UPI00240F59D8|nr:uncharacterized protein LOC129294124 isoform X2 [Prosopis cineraria]